MKPEKNWFNYLMPLMPGCLDIFSTTISIVVPSCNGLDGLKILIPSLGAQLRQPDEVVIVLDGSTDGSFDWLMAIKQACIYSFSLKIISQLNKGRGAAKVRGAQSATCEIIAFCDDDMLHEPSWILNHIIAHQLADVITGPVTPFRPVNGSNEFFLYYSFLVATWEAANSVSRPSVFTSANVSFKKAVYLSTGGFNAALHDAEDRDYSMRLNMLGVVIKYQPECVSHTCCYASFREYSARLRDYRKSNRLVDSNLAGSLLDRSFFVRRYLRRLYHGIKHSPFIHQLAAVLMDAETLRILPKNIRFKLYSRFLF